MPCCPNGKPSSSCTVSLIVAWITSIWPTVLSVKGKIHPKCLCLPIQKKNRKKSKFLVSLEGGNINIAEPRIDIA